MWSARETKSTMKKPTIYFDTNVISLLHYDGRDLNALSKRMATLDWWESESRHFDLWSSLVTENELADGVFRHQEASLRFVRRLKYVPVVAESRRLALAFMDANVIPANKLGDALQLALACVHNLDYLLTWNYSHLANVVTQDRGAKIVSKWGLRMPILVSPDSIPRANLGQPIRRAKHD